MESRGILFIRPDPRVDIASGRAVVQLRCWLLSLGVVTPYDNSR